jgi:hypothetical protein
LLCCKSPNLGKNGKPNFDPDADVEPIRALLDQGCDLESGGRPRKYKNRAECDRAYRERRKQREKTCEDILARTMRLSGRSSSRRRCADPCPPRPGLSRAVFHSNEARTVPRDEFVPVKGRQASGGRRCLNRLLNSLNQIS